MSESSSARRTYQIVNLTRQTILATRARLAASWWERAVGLLTRRRLEDGEALILPGAGSIHTIGMRFPIDVLVVNRHGEVQAALQSLPPGRLSPWWRGVGAVIECPVGTIHRSSTTTGDRLAWSAVPPNRPEWPTTALT